ncbi:hypothetical protein ACJ41O_001261 [Fusarium nematophilum]
MGQHHVPGLGIAVVRGEETSSKGFGYASFERNLPCDGDTIFDVASCAKSFTAAAVALLVDDDEQHAEVQFGRPLSELLPDDFVGPNDGFTRNVTLDHILGHSTGMAKHNDSVFSVRAKQPDNARSVTRNLRNFPTAADVGSRYLYCNMMYTVATHLVEARTQQSFGTFLEEGIFHPLGMTSSTLQPERAQQRGWADRMATGYTWIKEESAYSGFPAVDCPEGQGAGSIMSTANDFIKWVKALMNHEAPITDRIYEHLLKKRSDRSNARRTKHYKAPAYYAGGLEVYHYRDHMVVWHDGNVPGFCSRFIFLPAVKFGVVILGNSGRAAGVASILIRELMDGCLDTVKGSPSMNQAGQQDDEKKRNSKGRKGKKGSAPDGGPGNDLKGAKGQSPRVIGWAEAKRVHQELFTHLQDAQPQELPLHTYTGTYWHPGYHEMTVQVKDGRLFIDANDRSSGFTLTFEHKSDQRHYVAHLSDFFEGGDDHVSAEFVLDGDRAVKMGLDLEPAVKDLIWFERREFMAIGQDSFKH